MPYLCPAGILTCGWGSTGVGVFPGIAWTQEQADRRLEADALKFAKATLILCPSLRGKQLCAIADFAYNLGEGRLRGSTLRKKINTGDYAAVPSELSKWNKGGGGVLAGLTKRRTAEALLFSKAQT